jgi:hypothetical protein
MDLEQHISELSNDELIAAHKAIELKSGDEARLIAQEVALRGGISNVTEMAELEAAMAALLDTIETQLTWGKNDEQVIAVSSPIAPDGVDLPTLVAERRRLHEARLAEIKRDTRSRLIVSTAFATIYVAATALVLLFWRPTPRLFLLVLIPGGAFGIIRFAIGKSNEKRALEAMFVALVIGVIIAAAVSQTVPNPWKDRSRVLLLPGATFVRILQRAFD